MFTYHVPIPMPTPKNNYLMKIYLLTAKLVTDSKVAKVAKLLSEGFNLFVTAMLLLTAKLLSDGKVTYRR